MTALNDFITSVKTSPFAKEEARKLLDALKAKAEGGLEQAEINDVVTARAREINAYPDEALKKAALDMLNNINANLKPDVVNKLNTAASANKFLNGFVEVLDADTPDKMKRAVQNTPPDMITVILTAIMQAMGFTPQQMNEAGTDLNVKLGASATPPAASPAPAPSVLGGSAPAPAATPAATPAASAKTKEEEAQEYYKLALKKQLLQRVSETGNGDISGNGRMVPSLTGLDDGSRQTYAMGGTILNGERLPSYNELPMISTYAKRGHWNRDIDNDIRDLNAQLSNMTEPDLAKVTQSKLDAVKAEGEKLAKANIDPMLASGKTPPEFRETRDYADVEADLKNLKSGKFKLESINNYFNGADASEVEKKQRNIGPLSREELLQHIALCQAKMEMAEQIKENPGMARSYFGGANSYYGDSEIKKMIANTQAMYAKNMETLQGELTKMNAQEAQLLTEAKEAAGYAYYKSADVQEKVAALKKDAEKREEQRLARIEAEQKAAELKKKEEEAKAKFKDAEEEEPAAGGAGKPAAKKPAAGRGSASAGGRSGGASGDDKRFELEYELGEKRAQLAAASKRLKELEEPVLRAKAGARIATEGGHYPVPNGRAFFQGSVTTTVNNAYPYTVSVGAETSQTPPQPDRYNAQVERQKRKEDALAARRHANQMDSETSEERKELRAEIAMLNQDIRHIKEGLHQTASFVQDHSSLKVRDRVTQLSEKYGVSEGAIYGNPEVMGQVGKLMKKEGVQKLYVAAGNDGSEGGVENRAAIGRIEDKIAASLVGVRERETTQRMEALNAELREVESNLQKLGASKKLVSEAADKIQTGIGAAFRATPADMDKLLEQKQELDKQAKVLEGLGGSDAAQALRAASKLITKAVTNDKKGSAGELVTADEKKEIEDAMKALRTNIDKGYQQDESRIKDQKTKIEKDLGKGR